MFSWKWLIRRKQFEADLSEEFSFHKEACKQDLLRQGCSPEEAQRRVQLEFGGAPRYREECREAAGLYWLAELGRDLRYGLRTLRKNRTFSAAAILSLALGIGANTVVFSVFESLLLRPLPIADPGQVLFAETTHGPANSFPNYREFRDDNSTFAGLAGYRMAPMDLETEGDPRRIWGYLATGNYFDVLGLHPVLGRFFHAADDLHPSASPYAVLSYKSWQTRFAADRHIVGRIIRINGLSYTVLGVAPRDFHGTELFYWPEVWIPMMMEPQIEVGNNWLNNRHTWDTWIFGRLKPGITPAQATADLNRIANELARKYPDSDDGLRMKLSAIGLIGSGLRGAVRLFTGGLLLLSALVLLIACANLASLTLARATDRHREIAIRVSIGAGRGRIIRQLLTESLLVSFTGGVIGYALAALLAKLLSQWHAPVDFPVQFSVTPDWRVFLFAATAAVIAGILSGLGPALQVSKADVNNALKGDVGIALRGRFRLPLRDILVGIELALCFVLVFGSILSARALEKVLTMPLGIEPRGRVVAGFDLGLARYSEAQGRAFQQRVLNEIKRLPGVASAAYGNSLPLSIDQSTTGIEPSGEAPKRGRNVRSVTWYDISPGYIATLGIPLLRGRDFDRHDNQQSRLVAIVNQAFAKSIMRTDDPVGKTFRYAFGGPSVLVVGLVQDGKYVSLTEAPRPALFRPILQSYNSTTTLIVRTNRPASAMTQQIRRTMAGLDNRLPLYGTGTLVGMLGFALFPMQAAAVALGAFGILALVLAVTGIHGLVAYAVAQRTRELGIRIAIGANSSDVLRVILGRLGLLISAGLVTGLLLALGVGQILESVVYGASPRNPGLLLLVILVLLCAAALSCWKPALRALRTDPITALRYE